MTGRYYGGKWGVYLRAPDLWFELLDRYGHRLVPLAEIADVWFGVKSGKDCFFFPRDASAECLAAHPDPADFEARYGLPRADVASGRVKLVRCGEDKGILIPIESRFLEPEVQTIMGINRPKVEAADCDRLILLVSEARPALRGSHVLRYIEWGEREGYNNSPTCASRAGKDREWYDLTGHKRGDVLWPLAHQYKHIALHNPSHLVCNHRLFDVSPKVGSPLCMAGILNSSFALLSKFQYGRPVGVEGNLDTEVIDVQMMLVPDASPEGESQQARVADAFEKLSKRSTLYFLSERRLRRMAYLQAGKEAELERLSDLCELDMADRRELDDAVLEMMGETSPERRKELIDRLYAYLREFFEQVRQKEEKAIANKKRAKRRGAAKPSEVAAEILAEIKAKEPHLLQAYDPGFLDPSKPYDTYELPSVGEPSQGPLAPHIVEFRRGKKLIGAVHTKNTAQDDLLVFLARSGVRGLVRVPHDEEECRRVYERYSDFAGRRDERLRKLIHDRTADEEMQGRISDILTTLLTRSS